MDFDVLILRVFGPKIYKEALNTGGIKSVWERNGKRVEKQRSGGI